MAYNIGFDIFAKDRASATFDRLGRKVGETEGKFNKHAAAIGAGLATAGVALFGFAKSSIDAYTDAEKSQRVLTDAYQRFPALANVPLQSLRDQAQALQSVTKFDGDATAAAMGQLAAYKLNGTQIQQLTPLLLDYAQKTGKDLPTAAETLGKAILGNGRGLKDIGLNFKDTGTRADNFRELMRGLRTQVGGFAETEGKSAEGRAAILKNKFDDLKESVGSKLLPVLTGLANALIVTVDWIGKNQGKVIALAAGVAVLAAGFGIANALIAAHGLALSIAAAGGLRKFLLSTKLAAAGQWLLNAALTANPIGLVIAAIALLVVGLVYAYKHSEKFRAIVQGAFHGVAAAAQWMWNNVLAPVIRFILTGFANVVSGIASFLRALSHIPGFGWAKTAADKMDGAAAAARRLAGNIRNIPNKTVNVDVYYKTHGFVYEKGQGPTARAGGGPVIAKTLYRVGEQGPELFVPKTAGTIVDAKDTATIMAGRTGRPVATAGPGGGDVAQAALVFQLDTGVLWRGFIKYGRELGFQIVPA